MLAQASILLIWLAIWRACEYKGWVNRATESGIRRSPSPESHTKNREFSANAVQVVRVP